MSAEPFEKFIVRWKGYPVQFHPEVGRVYSVRGEPAEATAFRSIELAWKKAQEHNLRWAEITIQPLNDGARGATRPTTTNQP
jgi:uncharacterized protein YndB with AHSA1/START domain